MKQRQTEKACYELIYGLGRPSIKGTLQPHRAINKKRSEKINRVKF